LKIIPKFSRSIFVSLCGIIAIIIMLSNYSGQQDAVLASSFLNLAITTILVITSATLLVKYGVRGNFGKAWACFVSFVVLWFVAERIWMVFELVYQTDPWPSPADFFWLTGYLLYFAFTAFYLRPFKDIISAKLAVFTSGFAIILAGSIAYYMALQESYLSHSDMLLGLAYPILDSLSLAPIALGLILFARGQVNFVLACLFFGMIGFVVADFGFLFLNLDDNYHTGHAIDIPYLWAYAFFLFGTANYTQIFRIRNQENRFENQDKFK